MPDSFPPPEREGGREHDVRYDDRSNSWWKYTKPSCAGYTVAWSDSQPFLLNATPLEYLQRLQWQNEVFGDDVHLEGLWECARNSWCIVTSQPHVAGPRSDLPALRAAFVGLGFEVLPYVGVGYEGSFAVSKEGYDIWDIHPGNVRLSEQGWPIPFDLIITKGRAT